MKTNYLTIKNLATGAFLLSLTNGLLFTWFALAKMETPIRDKDGDIAVEKNKVVLREATPAPIPLKNIHLLYGVWAGINYCFAFSLWNGKKLSIQDQKSGQEVYSLPADVAKLLINRGYIAKPGPLLDQKTFADDCVNTCQKLLVNTAHLGFSVIEDGLSLGVDGATVGVKYLADNLAPPEVKSFFESKLAELDLGYDKFKTNSIHARIAGATGSGKTTITGDYIASYVERYQGNCQILIGDIHYLKPDPKTGIVNDWLGIDKSRVYDSVDRVIDLINYIQEELDRRILLSKQLLEEARLLDPEARQIDMSKFPPILIVIDEYSTVAGSIKAIDEKWAERAFYPIIKQCRAYRINFLLLDQSFAVKAGEMPLYMSGQFSKMLLGCGDISDTEFTYLGLKDGDRKSATDQIIQLVESGRKRVAIAQMGEGRAKVITIPDLSGFNYRFPKVADQVKWLDKHKPTILTMIGEGKSLTNIFQGLIEDQAIPNKRQSLDNPFYRVLKEYFDNNQLTINLTKSEV